MTQTFIDPTDKTELDIYDENNTEGTSLVIDVTDDDGDNVTFYGADADRPALAAAVLADPAPDQWYGLQSPTYVADIDALSDQRLLKAAWINLQAVQIRRRQREEVERARVQAEQERRDGIAAIMAILPPAISFDSETPFAEKLYDLGLVAK